jgi:hypothetical protein
LTIESLTATGLVLASRPQFDDLLGDPWEHQRGVGFVSQSAVISSHHTSAIGEMDLIQEVSHFDPCHHNPSGEMNLIHEVNDFDPCRDNPSGEMRIDVTGKDLSLTIHICANFPKNCLHVDDPAIRDHVDDHPRDDWAGNHFAHQNPTTEFSCDHARCSCFWGHVVHRASGPPAQAGNFAQQNSLKLVVVGQVLSFQVDGE